MAQLSLPGSERKPLVGVVLGAEDAIPDAVAQPRVKQIARLDYSMEVEIEINGGRWRIDDRDIWANYSGMTPGRPLQVLAYLFAAKPQLFRFVREGSR